MADVHDHPDAGADVTYSQLTPVIPSSLQKCPREGEDDEPQVHKLLKSRQYNAPVSQSKIEDLSVK